MLALTGVLGITTSPAGAEEQLDRVEVTGSSIKRIAGESALPVQVLTRDDIQKTGAATMEELLRTVSATTSLNGLAAASTAGASTGGISAVSMRGLGSHRTLVLLNGRRLAPYGMGFAGDSVSVDVNSIPLAAVERVEILKDGASAVYGSDAIAGVVNFILRKDHVGGEMTAEYGESTQGGGRIERISASYGLGHLDTDRFNVMLLASYQKEQPLFGRDRAFARAGIHEGARNDVTSLYTFPANIVPVDGTSFDVGNPSAPTGCLLPYSQRDPFFGPNLCSFDPSPIITLVPQSERGSVFGSARFAISSEIEAFAEVSFNRNRQHTVIHPVPISGNLPLPANHPLFNVAPYNGYETIVLTPASPYYPTAYVRSLTGGATPDLSVHWRASAAGDRHFTDISESPRLALGLRGVAERWDFSTAYVYSSSRVREQVHAGFPVLSQLLPLLNSGTVNLFGPNTPEVDAAIQATGFVGDALRVTSTLQSIAAKASRELIDMPAGPLAVAFGAELRNEAFRFEPHPLIQAGDVAGYGGNFRVTDKDRDVAALFAEVSVPLAAGVEVTGALRHDQYQGVGRADTPKVGLRWQPLPSVLVRASAGKGFRAPSLQDLYLPNTTGLTPAGLSDPLRCIPPLPAGTPGAGRPGDCQTQFPVTLGGNSQLKPERSENLTLGVVLEPTNDLSLALDAFKIKLKDTIENGIDAAVILRDLGRYGSLVTRGPADPANPQLPGPIINIDETNGNFGATRLSGVDVDMRWRLPATEAGRITVGLTGTYFISYDKQNPDGTFTGRVGQASLGTGGVLPRWKHYLSVNWSREFWSFTAAQSYQRGYDDIPGSMENTNDPNFRPRRVGAYLTYDVQGSYTGIKNLALTLGVRNLFDRDPPYTNAGGKTSFQVGYDPLYADPRGRFVYGRIAYAFR
jgi:iron complex outermembrane receptor protein